jgi:hypothetical protein
MKQGSAFACDMHIKIPFLLPNPRWNNTNTIFQYAQHEKKTKLVRIYEIDICVQISSN